MVNIYKILIGLLSFCSYQTLNAQIIDIDYRRKLSNYDLFDSSIVPSRNHGQTDSLFRAVSVDEGLQFLKNGFVDFLTDGNIQASARLLRINIGDRNKFYLPLFIYTGAAGNAFGEDKINKTAVSNLLNPVGGTFNLSFNGLQNLIKGSNITKLKFAYQIGGRMVNGQDTITKENLNFFNGIGNIGFFFQTGAWNPDDPNNMGVFYVQAKLISSISSKQNFQKLFGKDAISNNYLLGYSIDAGIEIERVINLKVGIYQFTNHSAVALFKDPVVKLSLDYSLKK